MDFDFDVMAERLSKVDPKLEKPADIARAFGVGSSTLHGWKSNDRIPYKNINDFCMKFSVNLNWMYFGIGDLHMNTTHKDECSISSKNSENTSLAIPDIAKAMATINDAIETTGLPRSEMAFEMLLKTYFDYKDTAELKIILEAIAKAQIRTK